MNINNPQETQPMHPVQPAQDAPAFQTLPPDQKYLIDGKIGEGGMGTILSATDRNIQRQVAMKILSEDQQAGPENVARFIDEVQITGQLEHPNIVPTYELGSDAQGRVYYTMKLVRGKTLSDILSGLKSRKSFDGAGGYTLAKLLQIFVQICNGISFAHSKGVIHRDLKPENIMLGEFGEVLIMDWGLAKVTGRSERRVESSVKSVRASASGTRTMDGTIMGTPSYMPPEQAQGDIEHIDQRSDVYGLGAILYEILTFAPPFSGKEIRRVLEDVISRPVIRPSQRALTPIPRELEAVCLKALSKNPNGRYQSARELANDIQQYLEGRSVSALADSLPIRIMKWVRRNRTLSASAAILILVSAGLYLGLSYYQQSKTAKEVSAYLAQAKDYESKNEYDRALDAYNMVLGIDAGNLYAVYGAKESKERLARLSEERQKLAVESEKQNKINEILKSAQAIKNNADNALASTLKPWEDVLFNVMTLEQLKKISPKYELLYSQWNDTLGEINAAYSRAIYEYFSVLQIDPNNEAANRSMADIYKAFYVGAEKRNDQALMSEYESAISRYDRQGRYTEFLKGNGRIRINSAPEGADVYLFKLEKTKDGRLAPDGFESVEAAMRNPDPARLAGQTPLNDWRPISMGSYVLLLRKPGYADVRYPILIERNESEKADIKLVRESDIPPGMVYIPAGNFYAQTKSNVRVILPGFFISKYEVTLGDYLKYLNSSYASVLDAWLAQYYSKDEMGGFRLSNSKIANIPINGVKLKDAESYVKWKSRKDKREYRLPIEEEWTKAARGADKRKYVWGDIANQNFANVSHGAQNVLIAPVGSFPADLSVYGVYDLTGNLSELTSDAHITSGNQYSLIMGGRINHSIQMSAIESSQLWMSSFATFEIGFRLVCSLKDE